MRLSVLFLLALVQPAFAQAIKPQTQTVAAVFERYGLFGEWAIDCGMPASPSNPRVLVTHAGDDTAVERHELGDGYAINTYRVLAAEPLSPTRVAIEALFQSGDKPEQRQRLVISVRGTTRRTLFTKVEGGPVRVKDGVAVGQGVKTPRLNKCG